MIRPLLIVGLPRSGTTWVGEIMRSTRGTRYLFEPDNEKISPLAWLSKQQLSRFPVLPKYSREPDYWQLWKTVFEGFPQENGFYRLLARYLIYQTARVEAHIGAKCGFVYLSDEYYGVTREASKHPFTTRTASLYASAVARTIKGPAKEPPAKQILIKSVHSIGALEWLYDRFQPDVLVVLRNPYSLYASYRRLRMPDGFRNVTEELARTFGVQTAVTHVPPSMEECHRIVEQITGIMKLLQRQIAAHPQWHTVSHDRLCVDPPDVFRGLFDRVGLNWGQETEIALERRSEAGQGFAPDRVASIQPTKWRSELSAEEIEIIDHWIDIMGLDEFLSSYVH